MMKIQINCGHMRWKVQQSYNLLLQLVLFLCFSWLNDWGQPDASWSPSWVVNLDQLLFLHRITYKTRWLDLSYLLGFLIHSEQIMKLEKCYQSSFKRRGDTCVIDRRPAWIFCLRFHFWPVQCKQTPHSSWNIRILGKGQDTGEAAQAWRMIRTLTSRCGPTVHFLQAHTAEEIRERISCQWAEFTSPLDILHITTEGTMCLQWQVAIVHNVLMLTKCQFDPWDRWVGWGCGSWILKQATVWCSYGDGRRHDTDETSNYLPNGRQIQGVGKGGGGRQWAGQMRGWVPCFKKAQR